VNVGASTPLLIVAGTAVVVLMVGLVPDRRLAGRLPTLLAAAGVLATLIVIGVMWGDRQLSYAGDLYADRFAFLVDAVVLVATLCTLGLSWREPAGVDRRGEYAGLLLLSATGMMLVAGAGDLVVIFLGIELLSVSLYVLCAIEAWRERSLESGLKYLIVGAVGSSILLYGLAFLYGGTGSTRLSAIGQTLGTASFTQEPLITAAMALIVVGLGFKASAVPFHMWTPDVYEGAPTPITAFMATATKAAAFAALLRIFAGALDSLIDDWQIVIAAVATATIVVGNVAALVQRNMKRLLAYSGIAQAGYLLIGVAAGAVAGAEATLYYLLAYLVMTMAAFAVVVVREREVEDGDTIASLAGYGRRRPLLGAVMTISMLSLAGFPPLAGFVGKFLVFGSAIDQDLLWLAIVGAAGSIVSLGYYLRVVGTVWLGRSDAAGAAGPAKVLRVPAAVGAVAILSALLTIGIAIAASPILDLCRGAAEALLAA